MVWIVHGSACDTVPLKCLTHLNSQTLTLTGLRGTSRIWFWACVAVSRGYDTCFSGKACDGLCRLFKSTGLGWIRSLVIRLYSEISKIHLSTEAQCGSPVYLWVDHHSILYQEDKQWMNTLTSEWNHKQFWIITTGQWWANPNSDLRVPGGGKSRVPEVVAEILNCGNQTFAP